MTSQVLLTLSGGGVQKCPCPPCFLFKYVQNEKMYDFALLWLLVISYFKCFCQISRKNFDWLTSYCDFVRGVPKNSKKSFFFNFFFLKQLFVLNISSIHYVEVVNIIFFIWNHIFLLVFEKKYFRIGNFVIFLSESMELTSDRFFYLLYKTTCFYLFIFFFL